MVTWIILLIFNFFLAVLNLSIGNLTIGYINLVGGGFALNEVLTRIVERNY